MAKLSSKEGLVTDTLPLAGGSNPGHGTEEDKQLW